MKALIFSISLFLFATMTTLGAETITTYCPDSGVKCTVLYKGIQVTSEKGKDKADLIIEYL